MIDNEIIKAVECCIGNTNCSECPLFRTPNCMNKVYSYAIDLINRQKTENESLKIDLAKCSIRLDNLYETAERIKFEAIKEFAKRLKEEITSAIDTYYHSNGGGYYLVEDVIDDIDNLVKEMTENDFKE